MRTDGLWPFIIDDTIDQLMSNESALIGEEFVVPVITELDYIFHKYCSVRPEDIHGKIKYRLEIINKDVL